MTTGPAQILYAPNGEPRVFHFERASATAKPLPDFWRWWAAHGAFPVVIIEGLRFGAEAEKRQAEYFAGGLTNARTLAETPHGRAGADDFAPVRQWIGKSVIMTYTGDEKVELDRQEARRRYHLVGVAAEKFGGVEWGGRFTVGPKKLPDDAHLQVAKWRDLPYPPILIAT